MNSKKHNSIFILLSIISVIIFLFFKLNDNDLDNSNEAQLISMYYDDALLNQRTTFFKLLINSDWLEIIEIDKDAAFKIMGIISSLNFENDTEISSVLSAYKGLDGTYSELYSNVVAKIYLQDELNTVSLLNDLPKDNIDSVVNYIGYGCSYYDISTVFNDSNSILQNNQALDTDKLIISRIIENTLDIQK